MKYPKIEKKAKKTKRTCYECKFVDICKENNHWHDNGCKKFKFNATLKAI